MNLHRKLAIFTLASTLPLATPAVADTAVGKPTLSATITIATPLSVDAATQKLTDAFSANGLTIFAIIDHQAAAHKANLTMQPAKVIVYGNPKAGTPLMVKDPHFALKLPLKVLVTQNQQRQTEVLFERTQTLVQDSNINYSEVENTLAKAEALISKTLK